LYGLFSAENLSPAIKIEIAQIFNSETAQIFNELSSQYYGAVTVRRSFGMFQRLQLWDFHTYKKRCEQWPPNVSTMYGSTGSHTAVEATPTPTTLNDPFGQFLPPQRAQVPSFAGEAGSSSIKPIANTTLPKFSTGPIAKSTRTHRDLLVYYARDEILTNLSSTVSRSIENNKDTLAIMPVESQQEADLYVTIDSNEVTFDILDSAAIRHGMKRIPYTIRPDAEELYRVLLVAAHYLDNYYHKPPTTQKGLIKIEFMKLQEIQDENDSERQEAFVPCSPNLINDQNFIELVGDEKTVYGIHVINKRDISLYIYLFYFDHTTLEIRTYVPMGLIIY
jgi:hypothetical protein